MTIADNDLHLRARAQVALLGLIAPEIRAISMEINETERTIRMLVQTESEIHPMARENMEFVVTELVAGYGLGWKILDEYQAVPISKKPEYLRLVVFARCESPDFLPPA
ncbi:MAG: hypothetical protein LBE51_17945 [Acidovorax sp.]|jgi:hypothetical protein|nr:hypothetical protein [Acidovorax sp.]